MENEERMPVKEEQLNKEEASALGEATAACADSGDSSEPVLENPASLESRLSADDHQVDANDARHAAASEADEENWRCTMDCCAEIEGSAATAADSEPASPDPILSPVLEDSTGQCILACFTDPAFMTENTAAAENYRPAEAQVDAEEDSRQCPLDYSQPAETSAPMVEEQAATPSPSEAAATSALDQLLHQPAAPDEPAAGGGPEAEIVKTAPFSYAQLQSIINRVENLSKSEISQIEDSLRAKNAAREPAEPVTRTMRLDRIEELHQAGRTTTGTIVNEHIQAASQPRRSLTEAPAESSVSVRYYTPPPPVVRPAPKTTDCACYNSLLQRPLNSNVNPRHMPVPARGAFTAMRPAKPFVQTRGRDSEPLDYLLMFCAFVLPVATALIAALVLLIR